jgi:hypothetical protein
MWVVAKPFILPSRARKRGNPNWGKPMMPASAVPTAFEEQVKKLGLTEQSCAASEKLRQWCERNKDRSYTPESLLKQWGILVDPNFSGWAATARRAKNPDYAQNAWKRRMKSGACAKALITTITFLSIPWKAKPSFWVSQRGDSLIPSDCVTVMIGEAEFKSVGSLRPSFEEPLAQEVPPRSPCQKNPNHREERVFPRQEIRHKWDWKVSKHHNFPDHPTDMLKVGEQIPEGKEWTTSEVNER